MAYSPQSFAVFQTLTSAQCNQIEINIKDHQHGVSAGVSIMPAASVSSGVMPSGIMVTQPGSGEVLRMIRGYLSASGAILSGTGFICSKAIVGVSDIKFTVAFSALPAVIPAVFLNYMATISNLTTSGCSINTSSINGNLINTGVMFTAIGPV